MAQTPLSHVGCGGYNARFFQAKGDQVVLSVDDEVGGDANRKRHRSNNVLDHSVRCGLVQFSMGR